MKKLSAIVSIIIIILIAAVTILALVYSKTGSTDMTVFPDNTTVNGVDCSGLTYREAEYALTEHWNSRHIEVTCSLGVRKDSFTNFGYEYDLTESLKKANGTRIISAAFNHYFNTTYKLQIPMVVSSYDKTFKKSVLNSTVFKAENTSKTKDAYVDISDPDFPIIPHEFGNEPDMERVFKDLTDSISNGDLVFVFVEKKYLKMPKVTADDPELLKFQKFCKSYLKQKITYKLGEETFTISPDTLVSLMKNDYSGEVDNEAVKTYVANLAEKYDNINSTREFTSFTGKDISVPPGIYGWMIDQEAETNQLIKDIESRQDVSREPVFYVKGYGEYSRDMGDTYIDVDVTNQMVRYYKEGKLIFSSPCVTGNRLTGTITDIGAYYVINKVRDVVLKGRNVDDTEYENFVSYWLGINWAGEGFHDATWRSSFGGNIWTYNGSHGCINMPPDKIPELYEKAEIGVPVAVHY